MEEATIALQGMRVTHVRLIHPGGVYTREYNSGRLNIHVDKDERVTRLSWG